MHLQKEAIFIVTRNTLLGHKKGFDEIGWEEFHLQPRST
jgi:hypothetical protein